jgi:hypothetical protein
MSSSAGSPLDHLRYSPVIRLPRNILCSWCGECPLPRNRLWLINGANWRKPAVPPVATQALSIAEWRLNQPRAAAAMVAEIL